MLEESDGSLFSADPALETRAISYFRAVAQFGSISSAAANLFVASSAIARQLDMLEGTLGARLLERGRRGTTLTPAGEAFLAHVDAVAAALAEVREQIPRAHHDLRGVVRIASVEGVTLAVLPDVVAELSARYPRATVLVEMAGSRDVADLVASGGVDIGVTFGPPSRSDVAVIEHVPAPLGVVVRSGHPLAVRDVLTLPEVAGARLVLPVTSFGIRQEIDRAAHEAGVTLDVLAEANSLAVLRAIVERTDAITFLPENAAGAGGTDAGARFVPLRNRRLEAMQLAVITALGARSSALVDATLDHLVRRLDALGPADDEPAARP